MHSETDLSKNFFLNLIVAKRWGFVRHMLLILSLITLYGFFDNSLKEHAKLVGMPYEAFFIGEFIIFLFDLTFIYFNLYYLFPRFLQKGKFNIYVLSLLIMSSLYFLISYVSQQIYVIYFGKNEAFALKFNFSDFFNVFTIGFITICCTTGYKIFKQWVFDQQRFAELEKQKISSELEQLKNQVNPHFLFNTLNNLHVLTLTNPSKASEIILGLSDVLRYQIYDSKNDSVLLKKDIEVIDQYLQLEKIRRDNLKYEIRKLGNLNDKNVPPLLFINFIDNAIKHSNGRADSFINILFDQKEKQLYFEIINSKIQVKLPPENSGFGLINVKKRLDLLYGKNYTLEILDEQKTFTVKLHIPL
jgi:sensor histidine kinase YesM